MGIFEKHKVFRQWYRFPSLLRKIPDHRQSFLRTPKWLTAGKENIKADGSDHLNTITQVLSKTEASASLPTLLVPASTSRPQPPHSCSPVLT